MHHGGSGALGLVDGEHGLQHVVLHVNEFQGLGRDFRCLGNHGCNPVTHVAQLLVEHASVVGRGLGIALSCWVVPDVGAVLVGYYGYHTGQCLCPRCIDGLYICMGMGTAQHLEVAVTGAHLVLDEGRFGPGKEVSVHFPVSRADEAESIPELWSDEGGSGVFAAGDSQLNGAEDLLVAGAAAEGA